MNLLDLLFPKRCVGCKKAGSYFCPSCIQNIKQTDLVCPFCERLSLGGVVHAVCRRKYGLDGLWSLGVYENPLRRAIQELKYRWVKELAQTLTDLTIDYWIRYQPILLEKIKKDQGKNWVFVPVPLHKSRQNWRGFNQSALLAESFSKKMGLEYKNVLLRIRKTRPQVGLESYQRKQNIRGAFNLAANCQLSSVNCILVDDVWTTGSTLRECCNVLKHHGVKTVWALTLAR